MHNEWEGVVLYWVSQVQSIKMEKLYLGRGGWWLKKEFRVGNKRIKVYRGEREGGRAVGRSLQDGDMGRDHL